jgi:hypothetical protein
MHKYTLGWRLIASALVVVCGALLGGCTPRSSMLAGLIDGTIAFTVCDSIAPDRIVVSKFDPSDSASGTTDVWVVRGGDRTLPAGSIVVVGQTPQGYEVEVPYVAGTITRPNSGFSILLDQTAVASDSAQFDVGELTEGTWVDSEGREIPGSCENLPMF